VSYYYAMNSRILKQAMVPDTLSGQRLDQVAAKLFPDYSRARLQSWIKASQLLVNGESMRPKDKVYQEDLLAIDSELVAEESWVAEALPLKVVYQDDALIVIDKPSGSVVHPAAGHRSGTLLNGLLHQFPELQYVPRAGIVHRLDKDTTGLMVVARTLTAHKDLVAQLSDRSVSREYEAVVVNVMTGGGTVNAPLGRNPTNRKKRAVREDGQEAITHYKVIQRFRAHTHIKVRLETGRTHQIRVHMSHIHYPIVGDALYGGRLRVPKACSEELVMALRNFPRQALHARSLTLRHPISRENIGWSSELPADMQHLIQALEADLKCN